MGILYKKGTFAKATTVTTQNITDVGFPPKVLILWTSNQTVETYEEHMMISYGFSDGTTDCVCVNSSADNVTTSDTYTNLYNDAIIQIINKTTGAQEALATLNAWLSNGFQLNWSVNAAPAAIIHYVAIGGSDIANIKVGTQSVGTTTTGNKTYTGVGFKPDFLMAVQNGETPAAGYAYNTTIEANAGIGISCMKSPNERWSVAAVSEDNRATSDTWRYCSITKCFTHREGTTGTLDVIADFISFDSDGFTWNYTTNTGGNTTNIPFIYLAVKGGVWDVGNETVPAANSTITTNTNAYGVLKGLMTFSIGGDTGALDNSITNANLLHIGGSDGINNGVVTWCDLSASALMVVTQIQNDNNCIQFEVSNATPASSTTISTGAASFRTSDFSIAYTNSDASARIMFYFTVSELLTPHSFGKINTSLDNNLGSAIFG